MQEWVTDIRDQCLRAKVPFFFKQWGRRSEEKSRTNPRRSHLGRDAGQHEFGEGVNEEPVRSGLAFRVTFPIL